MEVQLRQTILGGVCRTGWGMEWWRQTSATRKTLVDKLFRVGFVETGWEVEEDQLIGLFLIKIANLTLIKLAKFMLVKLFKFM